MEYDFERFEKEDKRRAAVAEWLGIIGILVLIAAVIIFLTDGNPAFGGFAFLIGIVFTGVAWGLKDTYSGPSNWFNSPSSGWF